MTFRTALNCQSWRCSVIGEDKPSRNGVILYPHAKFEVYSENVGLKHRIELKLIANRINPVMKHSIDSTFPQRRKAARWDRLSEWAVRWALTVYLRR